MDQAAIILKLKHGDPASFKNVVSEWQDKVFNTAISIVQNAEDAEDIVQDVFVTLYEKIKNFREESTLSTWIYRITVSKALDHNRKKQRQKHGGLWKQIFSVKEEDEPVNFDHPGVVMENKERSVVLFKALRRLPEKQQVAFTLHKMEGLTYQEIAAVMKTTLFAVESLQSRAKSNLKKILEKYYRQNL